MTLYEFSPTATEFLAREGEHWGNHGLHPWFFAVRLIVAVLVLTAIVLFVRGLRGRDAEKTLRDAYARGDVAEADYRQRLAVLRETRR